MTVKVVYLIQDIRRNKGLTIRALSDLSGVSKSQISDIETGEKDTTVKTLCMLATAVEMTPCDLFQYEVIKTCPS